MVQFEFSVRNLRVEVEPVMVELDDDDGLQWTALQTAFPGKKKTFHLGDRFIIIRFGWTKKSFDIF